MSCKLKSKARLDVDTEYDEKNFDDNHSLTGATGDSSALSTREHSPTGIDVN